MQSGSISIHKLAVILSLTLMVGCISKAENPIVESSSIDWRVDPKQTSRPLRCEVLSFPTNSKKTFQDDQVEEPWQLYLSICNSPSLKAVRVNHTIAPRDWIAFSNPGEEAKFMLGYYDNSNMVTLGVKGFDFRISDALRKSLTEFIKQIEAEGEKWDGSRFPSPYPTQRKDLPGTASGTERRR